MNFAVYDGGSETRDLDWVGDGNSETCRASAWQSR